jgi:hypothetical protein
MIYLPQKAGQVFDDISCRVAEREVLAAAQCHLL